MGARNCPEGTWPLRLGNKIVGDVWAWSSVGDIAPGTVETPDEAYHMALLPSALILAWVLWVAIGTVDGQVGSVSF